MGDNYFGITDPGRQRTNNEDSFIAQPVFKDQFIIACVIDGVGGYEGGEIAAELTREEIMRKLDKLPSNITDSLAEALENANERIIREKAGSPQHDQMACVVTLALVDIEKNVFYFAHVGDTRLYLFRDGSLIKITRDHSAVGFLEESGRLTEEAAMMHPKRNEVNKVLGYQSLLAVPKGFIDSGESPFLPGDTILLCSDGLTDMIPAGKIISILKSGNDWKAVGQQLIDAANEAGGNDNVTVVLVNNDKSPVQHEVTKPLGALKKNETGGDGALKIAEKSTISKTGVVQKKRENNNGRMWPFLCLLLFAGFAWLLYEKYKLKENNEVDAETLVTTPVAKQRNAQEVALLDSIHASKNGIVRLSGSQPIVLTESFLIKNDSLHIIGNGISLVSDSAYTGPAFILSDSCKYILLDSIGLNNFKVGILVQNRGLHLKNVRFRNCIVPMQFQKQVSMDSLVSGAQAEKIFY